MNLITIFALRTLRATSPFLLYKPSKLGRTFSSMTFREKGLAYVDSTLDASGVTKYGALVEETFDEKERAVLQRTYTKEINSLTTAALLAIWRQRR